MNIERELIFSNLKLINTHNHLQLHFNVKNIILYIKKGNFNKFYNVHF